MEDLILARIQFASTTLFHFIFVPLSIGLAFIIAIMQTLYVVKKEEIYKKMAQFWGKFFLINFAVGVVTGILQEFQFGMNWSSYSRFVGDVFGAPLAIEALLAFFIESTFIGLWIFGWDKLPKKLHLACIWLVSIGTAISALWILVANSFMQNPLGYVIENGRAEMNDFFAVITNPKVLVAFPHTIFACFATGAFFILGMSAWKLLQKKDIEFFKRSMTVPMIVGLISTLGIAFSGHSQATYLMDAQPMKMAAAEGVWEDTADPAPWTLFAILDTDKKEASARIEIPYALSYLAYGKFSGSVEGMNTLQEKYEKEFGDGNYIPPVKTTFWSFRIMVAAGGLMILLTLIGLIKFWRGKLENSSKYLKWMIPAIFFPFIANFSGWIMSEIGRQPWIVYGLMTTADGISPNVSAGSVLFSLITFSLIYTLLAIAMVYLFVRVFKEGPFKKATDDLHVADPFSEGGVANGAK
ncbi:cytochrome ubiquinol oxidase subunit I [Robertmurraya andreesenii]|uniref:Cytochrome d ubiquinol oxidase subunit I n=1 Tax=Anoxybacillus andreesenii TaxID=1325932 RepID=A0ABT9V5M0_9BACL|nr:cytochrome ubiquinol oxidase subunit I [Robertmurraya andreesenii]MDQ0156237.1 cytochrome d ubiquinol oxidase subunit I [Robertmurraya andreesenii]